MTSTEFTVGIGEGSRISSKVLKPPGGGSSDIFGLGNSVANKASSERVLQTEDSNTHNRVFGGSNASNATTPAKSNVQSNIFENGNQVPPKQKKVYVRRNPITGEEVEICLETENDDKIVCDNKEVDNKEEETINGPSKPVQTSIRVRNPPGGKSSGIF